MENNLKEPVIVDFFGLPGCGKSTISHVVAEKLRSQGYQVAEPSYCLDHKNSNFFRKIKKVYQFLRVLSSSDRKKYLDIRKLVQYSTQSIGISHKINIATKIYGVTTNQFVDFVVFDEGFCQAVISLGLNLNNDEIEKIYLQIRESIDERAMPVYVRISIEEALKRIKKRGETNSRVERQHSEEQQLELMRKFDKGCGVIEQYSKIEVNSMLSTNETADLITNKILEFVMECRNE